MIKIKLLAFISLLFLSFFVLKSSFASGICNYVIGQPACPAGSHAKHMGEFCICVSDK
jgi:hypothetical protein